MCKYFFNIKQEIMPIIMEDLREKKVAILATHGFEQSEFEMPKKRLEEENAEVHVVAPEKDSIKAWSKDSWGDQFEVDRDLDEALQENYDALLLPGGVMNPDQLRMNSKAVQFATSFFKEGKPVAAICHGPQLLIETGTLQGRRMTSYPSIKTDLKNAGVRWEDREVVVDQGLVTSRTPNDLKAFCDKMVEEIKEGTHAAQETV